ncbi:cell division protein ZapA [Edaphobacillus lindanitolerans]|uniref:Cell division protein ZapA n=1 Tax=Edaphobacillus lindanitolerans TaxID=550447 RepID=A0A1U7PQF5_9BACI|nr:cell division protein ZapA [Edaphobacillus lindanitolerans]SIT83698.1 cell division protein ZapA [Edaphobacillus lindanitolerans]
MTEPEKIRVAVEIYGQTYQMVGTESGSHMRLVATLVDDMMREISSKNRSLDTTKIAVLTAVNTVNDAIKLKDRIKELENELKLLKG